MEFLLGDRALSTTDITDWNYLFKGRSLVAFEDLFEIKRYDMM